DVVGRLLRSLAAHSQVICVTHAPQVAALGHHHLQVRKDERQETSIEPLGADKRVEELARMLAGAGITDKSRAYARSLLDEAVEELDAARRPAYHPRLFSMRCEASMRPLILALFTAALVAQAGCSLPRVHKVTVQQGNVITQEMIDRLKPGMTRSQVAYVMGEPVLRHAFEKDRWDYI